MALIACHECGARISDGAQRCPQCGAVSKQASKMATATVILLLIIFVGWMLIAVLQ